jgi:alcohol dehydrogenase class IV
MLPAVMRWNAGSNPGRQELIAGAMGRPGDGAAPALAELVAELGLPMRLRDVGVTRQDFGPVAGKALGDMLVKNNPRPVRSAADIEEILELAW